jgi:hypothetical protein
VRPQSPVPDAHGTQAPSDGTVNAVPVADHVARSLIPGKCFRDLTRNPFGSWICCDVDPDKVSAVQPNDDEGIEQSEANGRDTSKSMAATSGAWLCRKARRPWLGSPHRLTMYLATLDCATLNPSLSSSPWMRGAPQSGFSMLIDRINMRSSASIWGHPLRERDFQRQ